MAATELDPSHGISKIDKRTFAPFLELISIGYSVNFGKHITKRQLDTRYQITLSVAILLMEMVGWGRD